MIPNASRFLHGIPTTLRLALLAFSLCGNAWADNAIDIWRSKAGVARTLAENDVPAAYKEALRLQATLPADATPSDRARLLNLLSRIEVYLALTDTAAAHAQQAFDLAKQHEDRVGQAEADLNIVLNSINQGRLEVMAAAATHSMTILEGADRPDLLGEAMLGTAMWYRRIGLFDDSVAMIMQAMEIARRTGDPIALLYAHHGMAFSLDQSDHLEEAREHFTRMREQARAARSLYMEAQALIGLGRVIGRLGDESGSERLLREAIAIYRKIGTPFLVAQGTYALADNMKRYRRTTAILPLLDQVVAVYEQYPNKIGMWWTLTARSTHYQSLGRVDEARADAERAYGLARDVGFPFYLSESAKRLAAIAAGVGDHSRAYQLAVEADEMTDKAAREKAGTRMVELSKRYETESKQRQLDKLNRLNEQQTAALRLHALYQRWLITVAGSSLALLFATVVFLLRLRRSHRQLQRSRNDQQAILDAIPDLLFEMGLDGRYYDCHSLCPDFIDAPVEGLHGKTVFDDMPPDAADICLSALREAHELGISTGKQYSFPMLQGMGWFELSVASKTVGLGEEPRFIVLSRDITERKKLEDAVRESERQFRTLTENLPDNITRYDKEYRKIYVNSVLEKTLGGCVRDLLGKAPQEIDFAPQAGNYQECLDRAIKTGEPCETELTLLDAVGETRYHHVRFVAERDAAGEIVGALAIGCDITAKRLLQDELEKREQQFRSLAENMPDMVARFDRDGRYLYCNRHLMKLIGLQEAEILGRTPVELRNDDGLMAFQDKIAAVFRSGREDEMILVIPARSCMRKIHDHIRFTPEFDASGQVISVLTIGRDISALKDAERRMSTLVENIPDFIVRRDTHGRQLYISPSVSKAIGMPVESFIGKTAVEMGATGFPANDQALVDSALRCAATGMPDKLELEVRDMVLDIVHMPEFDEFGKVETVLSVSHDITARKRTEEALVQREQELRTLFDNTPDLILRYDRNCRRILVNKAVEQVTGKTAADLLGETPGDAAILDSHVSDRLMQFIRQVLETGLPFEYELEYVAPSQRKYISQIRYVPEFGLDGQVVSVLSICRDITGIKQMETMLRKSERKFRTLAENSPEIILRYDRDCRRIYINPAYERHTGTLLNTVWNKTPEEYWIYLVPQEEYMDWLKRVMETGESKNILLEWHDPHGSLVSHDMHAVAEYDEQRHVIGVLVMGHNITELKATERYLEESRAQLRTLAAKREEAREEERKRIAREIHDELGQLLSVLRIHAVTIDYCFSGAQPGLHDKADKMIATVDRAILMIRNLVTGLRPEVLSKGIVCALEWLVQEYTENTGIACVLHKPDDDIPMDEDRRTAVFRIVQESLTNVLRHSGADRIEISLRQVGEDCEVEVSDNGKGFETANSGRCNSFGIVGMRERALALGGELDIVSAPTDGTVLKLCLPLAESEYGLSL